MHKLFPIELSHSFSHDKSRQVDKKHRQSYTDTTESGRRWSKTQPIMSQIQHGNHPSHAQGRNFAQKMSSATVQLKMEVDERGLSGTSGLASNSANGEIASSSGASEHQDNFFFDVFSIFFLKKT
jgi:hypothetical protein